MYIENSCIIGKITFKFYFTLIVFSAFFYSCSKEKIDAPEAIRQLISTHSNCLCEPYIYKYLWRSNTVYLSSCAGPACDCTTTYYDENGHEFKMQPGYSPDNFRQESQFLKNVWTCKK